MQILHKKASRHVFYKINPSRKFTKLQRQLLGFENSATPISTPLFRINFIRKQNFICTSLGSKTEGLGFSKLKAGETKQQPVSPELLFNWNQVHSVFQSKPYYSMKETVGFEVLRWSLNFLKCQGRKVQVHSACLSERWPNLSDNLIWTAKKSQF